jgi:ribA/ribD-fused uncharacterized protein
MKSDNLVCFYRENDAYGELSNWINAPFKYAGIQYQSSLQFIMLHKVMMFGQRQIGQKIMQETSPEEIKKLATKFEGYRDMLWDVTCEGVAYRGIRAKFQQNPQMAEKLLATGNKVIAFCSPLDQSWGTGISLSQPDAYEPAKWKGRNRLGRVLMDVRSWLRLSVLATGGILPYIDIKEGTTIPEFRMTPGELQMIPDFTRAIQTYILSLPDQHAKDTCLWSFEMGRLDANIASLPRMGLLEMKQEVFDNARLRSIVEQKTRPAGEEILPE